MTNNKDLADSILQSTSGKEDRDEDTKLIKAAKAHYKEASEGWSDIRKEAIQDQKFYFGEHYEATSQSVSGDNKPRIQVNMLKNKVQQVENYIRQQNIGITVHATDEAGTEQKATILQGIIRHIEHISNAKHAYLSAAGSRGALVPGFGFIKLVTNYINKINFDQEIYIENVKDPMKILPDFMAVEPDFSDARFWFEEEYLTKEEYKERFSSSSMAQPVWSDWGNLGTNIGGGWIKDDSIRIVKYWYKDVTIRHLGAFEDGTVGYLDEYGVEPDENGEYIVVDKSLNDETNPRVELGPDEQAVLTKMVDSKADVGVEGKYPVTDSMIPMDRLAKVLKHREVEDSKVYWCITNGVDILARDEWQDSEFPFVAVCGNDEVIDGKRQIYGVIRHAKDAQKLYNYMTSAVVQKIDASNKAPWLAAIEAIPDSQRGKWATSNRVSHAILYYKHKDGSGTPMPPPQRADGAEPAIQGLLMSANKFEQDVNKTIGVYEAQMGQGLGDRQSGVAIDTLAERGEQTNFHFSDNLVMAVKRLGSLIIRLMPKIYDTPRAIRIINPDDSAEVVKVNQMFSQGGKQVQYDLTTDESYDVVVDTGPTFATQKSENNDQLLKIAGANPQMAPLIMDMIASNMDSKMAPELQRRIKLLQAQTMPWLHAGEDMGDIPPAVQAKLAEQEQLMAHASQQIQQLAQENQQLKFEKNTNVVAHASKERIETMKSLTTLQVKRIEAMVALNASKDRTKQAALKLEIEHIQHHQQVQLAFLKHITPQPEYQDFAASLGMINAAQTGGPTQGTGSPGPASTVNPLIPGSGTN